MPTLTIPDVDDDLARRLRTRAAVHGRSMEAEAKSILADAVGSGLTPQSRNIADGIRAVMAPLGGVDLAPFPDEPVAEPVRFG